MKGPGTLKKASFLFILFVALSCGKEEDTGPSFNYVAEYEEVSTISAAAIKAIIAIAGLDFSLDIIEHDVNVYRVEYRTDYLDEEITASGIIALPIIDQAKGTISFQHGTIAADAEAPSNNLSTNDLLLYATLASTGLIVSIPDYIGFGSSVDIMHPYYVESLTASAVVDQLYASGELARAEGLDFIDHLYLAGYSQGGYATMATHKFFEESGIDGYDLKASFPAAGGYDVEGMRDYFFSLQTYPEPFFIAYVAEAYRITYNIDNSLELFFNEPYASRIPDLFGGNLTGSEINAQLTIVISDLITDDYLNNRESSVFDELNEVFANNSITDWTPTIDMLMYHGSADSTVLYQNSVDVFNEFNSNNVTLFTIQGGNHATSLIPYLEDLFLRLNDYIN